MAHEEVIVTITRHVEYQIFMEKVDDEADFRRQLTEAMKKPLERAEGDVTDTQDCYVHTQLPGDDGDIDDDLTEIVFDAGMKVGFTAGPIKEGFNTKEGGGDWAVRGCL